MRLSDLYAGLYQTLQFRSWDTSMAISTVPLGSMLPHYELMMPVR